RAWLELSPAQPVENNCLLVDRGQVLLAAALELGALVARNLDVGGVEVAPVQLLLKVLDLRELRVVVVLRQVLRVRRVRVGLVRVVVGVLGPVVLGASGALVVLGLAVVVVDVRLVRGRLAVGVVVQRVVVLLAVLGGAVVQVVVLLVGVDVVGLAPVVVG